MDLYYLSASIVEDAASGFMWMWWRVAGPKKLSLRSVDSVDENKCAGKTLQSSDTNSYATHYY